MGRLFGGVATGVVSSSVGFGIRVTWDVCEHRSDTGIV